MEEIAGTEGQKKGIWRHNKVGKAEGNITNNATEWMNWSFNYQRYLLCFIIFLLILMY